MDSNKTPGRAMLDDGEIYRLHSEEGLPYSQIMARVGCSKGGVSKAITRWKSQHPDTADRNGGAPGEVTTAAKPALELVHDADVIDLKPDSVDIEEADLDELAAIANRWHGQAVGTYLESAWHAGSALIAAKAQLDHGQWLPWLESFFNGSRQTAADYMRIAGAGDSPADVVSSLHLSETPQPSINAATKALSGGTSKPTPQTGSKDSTVVNRFLKRMDAVADAARTDVSKRLGTMTQTEALITADKMRGAIDVLEHLYDLVSDIADAKVTS
jgi:Protein of unknown function (DUF3102)